MTTFLWQRKNIRANQQNVLNIIWFYFSWRKNAIGFFIQNYLLLVIYIMCNTYLRILYFSTKYVVYYIMINIVEKTVRIEKKTNNIIQSAIVLTLRS